ncbi:MAG: anaerobic ribonucleoside-triphosphate reductase activating protein [Oscillospiraceae bacterium]|nr:anaerobic ribonucleoside-triphosphate reductase activating protein [Oscillospiraceae bacterium]
MNLAGLQKLTLLDYPDKTACSIFIAGCNFLCPYCHNPRFIAETHEDVVPIGEDVFFAFLQSRQGLIDGVCISGGEPLMFDEIFAFAAKIKELGFLVKIDTNGGYPGRLKKLVASGSVDYVAMDIKNTLEKYPETIGMPDYDTAAVKESVEYLLSDVVSYEFRTTVLCGFHTKDDLCEIARMIKEAGKYYLQGFDGSKETLCDNLTAYSEAELRELCTCVREILPCTELRGM